MKLNKNKNHQPHNDNLPFIVVVSFVVYHQLINVIFLISINKTNVYKILYQTLNSIQKHIYI